MRAWPQRWRILSQYYYPEIGAAPVRLHALARELLKRGFEVEVFTAFPNYPKGHSYPDYRTSWPMREVVDGVRVVRVPIVPGTGNSPLVRFTNYFSFTLSVLLPALFSSKCDVLFVESRPSLGMVALIIKWVRGTPYIYNVADLQLAAAHQLRFLNSRVLQRLAARMETCFLRKSWKVSTVSRGLIQHFGSEGLPRERVTYLPNGVDTDLLRPQPPDPEMLARWHCHGKIVFLYAGTHGYVSGADTFLHAISRLHERLDLLFLIVGEGPERSRLMELRRKLALPNVVFEDAIPYREMRRLYSIAYASIATVRNIRLAESIRLAKVLPALSCGVPVIFSGEGETANLISQHSCGLVVPPEAPEQLADAIGCLANNPLLRQQLSVNARELALRECDWSTVVENWLQELVSPQGDGLQSLKKEIEFDRSGAQEQLQVS